MLPNFPLNSRDYIQEMIDDIGRPVQFVEIVSVSGCYLCNYDPIAETSTDSFCPVCSGRYWIPTYSGVELQAHVTYGQVDDKTWVTGGIIDNGTVTVKVMYSGGVPDLINNSEYVIVDDRTYDVVSVDVRGVPEVNRILVKLKEKER